MAASDRRSSVLHQQDVLADHGLAGLLDSRRQADRHVRTQLEPDFVGMSFDLGVEQFRVRPAEAHAHVRHRCRQALAGANRKAHAAPARVSNRQARRDVRLDAGIRRDAGLAPVAAVLAAHDVLGRERRIALKQLDLRRFDRRALVRRRRIHRQHRQHLQQVVLKDVAHRADLFVEAAARPHAERLGHRDLRRCSTCSRFQIGSRNELANRKYSRFCTGSLPRKWSMRKIAASGNDSCSVAFSSRADARSRPNGFSTTRRAPRGAAGLARDRSRLARTSWAESRGRTTAARRRRAPGAAP